MDDDGQLRASGEFHLANEYALLHIARRMIVIVVQADFSPGDYSGIARKLPEFSEVGILREPGFVGMNADSRVNRVILLSDLDRTIEGARSISCTDSKQVRDAGISRARHHLLAIGIETIAVEMAVGVNEHGICNSTCGADIPVRCCQLLDSSEMADIKSKSQKLQTRMSSSHGSFQPRPHRHIFEKTCQHWFSAFERRGQQHPIRLQPAHLSRSQIGDDHDLAAN